MLYDLEYHLLTICTVDPFHKYKLMSSQQRAKFSCRKHDFFFLFSRVIKQSHSYLICKKNIKHFTLFFLLAARKTIHHFTAVISQHLKHSFLNHIVFKKKWSLLFFTLLNYIKFKSGYPENLQHMKFYDLAQKKDNRTRG